MLRSDLHPSRHLPSMNVNVPTAVCVHLAPPECDVYCDCSSGKCEHFAASFLVHPKTKYSHGYNNQFYSLVNFPARLNSIASREHLDFFSGPKLLHGRVSVLP